MKDWLDPDDTGVIAIDGIYSNSQNISGDVNLDNEVNVLDVILVVNLVLNGEFNNQADLNSDGLINVLDVVQLVNIILN